MVRVVAGPRACPRERPVGPGAQPPDWAPVKLAVGHIGSAAALNEATADWVRRPSANWRV